MADFIDDFESSGIPLGDHMKMETDRRKVHALVDAGVISEEDLSHAKVVEMVPSCECEAGLEMVGVAGGVPELICPRCHMPAREGSL